MSSAAPQEREIGPPIPKGKYRHVKCGSSIHCHQPTTGDINAVVVKIIGYRQNGSSVTQLYTFSDFPGYEVEVRFYSES